MELGVSWASGGYRWPSSMSGLKWRGFLSFTSCHPAGFGGARAHADCAWDRSWGPWPARASGVAPEGARSRNTIRLLRLEIKPDLPPFHWDLGPSTLIVSENCKLHNFPGVRFLTSSHRAPVRICSPESHVIGATGG